MAIYIGNAQVHSVSETSDINMSPCTVSIFPKSYAKNNYASSTAGDSIQTRHSGVIIDNDVFDNLKKEVKLY